MGWNEINILNKHSLFDGIENLSDYYFAHSYYFDAKNKADIVCSVKYEEDLVAAILKDNIFGTQFHPEKSQENGIKLLSNFLNWKIK
jgi:glutamine amidotransferase